MKMSFCADDWFLSQAKRQYLGHYPFQQHWPWREGFALVCFKNRSEFASGVRSCGSVLLFKAMIQNRLAKVMDALV